MGDRALVTGGQGFIGLHLVRALVAEGSQVTVLDDLSRRHVGFDVANLGARVTVVEHDLTTPLPDGLLAPVDEVYHLAAVVGVANVQAQPGRVLEVNIGATRELLSWCDRIRPRAVFLASTSEFGDGATRLGTAGFPTPESVPFVVEDIAEPRASYALSKAVSEAMFLNRSKDMKVRIGRFFNVYGPRMGHAHVIPQLLNRVQQGVNPFPVFGGHQRRSFCYVADAVTAAISLVRQDAVDPLVVNIGNDAEEIEIADLANLLFSIMGVTRSLDFRPEPASSPARRLPDLSRLRRLGIPAPTTRLEEGLRETIAWYLNHDPAPWPIGVTT